MSANQRIIEPPDILSELTQWQRYPDVLEGAVRHPHYREYVDALCALLIEMNDPLVLLSTLHIVAKSYLEDSDDAALRVSRLFYESPGFESIPDLGPYNQIDQDGKILEEIWGEISAVAAIIIRCFKEVPCAEEALNENSDAGRRFWENVIENESIRQVLKGAFLAGIGKDIRLLDTYFMESVAFCVESDGGEIDQIPFLKKRLSIMLAWLEENLSKEQITALPALIDFSARVVVLNHVTTQAGDDIYFDCSADKILTADPLAGLQAICRAYNVHGDGDEFSDILDKLGTALNAPVEIKLRELCAESADTDFGRGARAILEDYYPDRLP